MGWTTPLTWEQGQKVTAEEMNTHVRDNLNYLKDRFDNNEDYIVNEGSDYTTTSTSFADVDVTNLALTITTDGGDVLVGFVGSAANNSATTAGRLVYFNIDVDGADYFGDDGCHSVLSFYDYPDNASFIVLIEGLSADSHTFKLRWKVTTGTTGTLYAGAGTGGFDLHPQFWVQEQ